MLTVLLQKIKGYKSSLPITFGLIGMMLLLTFIFGAAFSSEYKPLIYIVDKDSSDISRNFVEALNESNRMNFKETTYDEAVGEIQSEKAITAIILEEGFSEAFQSGQVNITLIKNREVAEFVEVRSLVTTIGTRLRNNHTLTEVIIEDLTNHQIAIDPTRLRDTIAENIQDRYEKKATYEVQGKTLDNSDNSSYDNLKHSLIGYALFFSMFMMIFGIGTIIDEKKCYVWQRQLVSPLGRGSILAGNMLATIIMGFLQLFLMVYLGKYLFDIDWGNSNLGVMIVLTSFVFCVSCIGLFMASFIKTQQQLSAITPVVLVSTSMLGGCMWPLDLIQSKVLLFLAGLTPQKWALEGIEKMVMYGYGIEVIIQPVIILVSMGILYFFLGMLRLIKSES